MKDFFSRHKGKFLLLGLVVGFLTASSWSSYTRYAKVQEINESQLEDYVLNREVEGWKLNQRAGVIYVTLKKGTQGLQEIRKATLKKKKGRITQFAGRLRPNLFKGRSKATQQEASGPHCKFYITNVTDFLKLYRGWQKKFLADAEAEGIEVEWPDLKLDPTPTLADVVGGGISFLMSLLWVFFILSMLGRNGIFGMGKSGAVLLSKEDKTGVKFSDLAGMFEAKEELEEIVDSLKYPKKYIAIGSKPLKGVLLIGPPGTGKTYIAKALAGEAGVPFFYITGSSFVEMFVGVGPARVRELFEQARQNSPCIIFIDEIDTIGGRRGEGSWRHEEREGTLNQLLTEMDGFAPGQGILVVAATNRADILDPALLRPGRFDRKLTTHNPDYKERMELVTMLMRTKKMVQGITPESLAKQTVGFSQAEITNVFNEAGRIAARNNKQAVEISDLEEAISREIGGVQKKSRRLSPKEKEIVAIHESGHASASWLLPNASPFVKATIIPRGEAALGYAQYLPEERFLDQRPYIEDEVVVLLAGRAAEEVVLGAAHISTGAQNDLERATYIVYNMLVVYGMNDKVGKISYRKRHDPYAWEQRPYSEAKAQLIDEEAKQMLDNFYTRAVELMTSHKEQLLKLAELLKEKETISATELEAVLGPRLLAEPQPLVVLPTDYKE